MRRLVMALILCSAIAVPFAVDPARAQGGDSVMKSPESPDALQAEIDALVAQIAELEQKANEMLAPSQQEEKKDVRNQISILKRQLRLKRMQKQNMTTDTQALGQDQIRTKYRDQIRAIEAQKTAARRETIAKFEKMLADSGEERMNPDIQFRLAQLYFEEAHDDFNARMDAYDAQIGAGSDPGEPPIHDFSRSVAIYNRILADHPDYANIDMVFYMLAYCLTEAGDENGALAMYQRLLTEKPDSPFVAESHIRMGEIYFDRGELDHSAYDQAIAHYKQVQKNSKFYDKALYKLGWTYYKMANVNNREPYGIAIEYFKQVLRYYESRPTKRLGGGDDLRKEAIDYIAISFADYGDQGLGMAQSFFAQSGQEKWNRDILRKMSEVYFGNDDFENGRKATLAYLERYPNDPKNPTVHMQIVDSYYREAEWEKAVAESERMATLYGPESTWAKVNEDSRKEDRVAADKTRMNALYASATFHHEKSQRSSVDEAERADSLRRAITSYEKYTREYPDGKNYYEALFNLAEAYYAVGDYMPAAGTYRQVAKDQQGKYYADARFAVVKSLEKQIEKEGGLPNKELRDKITKGGGAEVGGGDEFKMQVVPLSATAQAYVDELVAYAPDAKKGEKIPGDYLFAAGEVQFWHGHVAEAQQIFSRVMTEYPGTKAADAAKFYSVEGAKLEGNLQQISQILAANPSADPETRKKEIEMASAAGLLMASRLADEGKYPEALAAYNAAYQDNPTAKDAPTALHNSAVLLETKMNNLAEANRYLTKVAEEFPKYQYAQDDLFHAAYNYERLGEFAQAQQSYERFSSLFPDHKDAQNSLYNAALLALKDHDFGRAEQLASAYSAKYATAADAGELYFLMAKTYESLNDDASAEQVYRRYTERFTNDPARLVEAYAKVGARAQGRGDSAEAQRNLNLAVGVYQRFGANAPESKKYAAMARFQLAQPMWDSYVALRFTGNLTTDASVLKQKSETYKTLKTAYEEVANFGDFEWFTAALHMTGMLNREFSESLFKAPIPEGLSPEQEDEYVIKLEDIAFPIKAKAQEAFEKNVEKGNAERVRNKWIDQSAAMLPFYKSKVAALKFEEAVFGTSPSYAGGVFNTETMPMPTSPPPGGAK